MLMHILLLLMALVSSVTSDILVINGTLHFEDSIVIPFKYPITGNAQVNNITYEISRLENGYNGMFVLKLPLSENIIGANNISGLQSRQVPNQSQKGWVSTMMLGSDIYSYGPTNITYRFVIDYTLENDALGFLAFYILGGGLLLVALCAGIAYSINRYKLRSRYNQV